MDAAVSPERERGKAGERGWPVCVRGPGSDRGEAARVRSASGGWGGGGSERGEDPTPGGAAAVGCGRRPPSRGPCGAWRLPAPTSASSATAPSLGRRARDRVGPDAGYKRAQQQQHRCSGRAGGAGRGLARGIVGKAWGGGPWDGGRRGGADGRAGRFRLTWPSVRRPLRLRLPLPLGDRGAIRSTAPGGSAAEGSHGRKEGRKARPFRSRCQGDGETRVEGSGLLILPRDLVKGWVPRKRPIWLKVENSPELTPFAKDWTEQLPTNPTS